MDSEVESRRGHRCFDCALVAKCLTDIERSLVHLVDQTNDVLKTVRTQHHLQARSGGCCPASVTGILSGPLPQPPYPALDQVLCRFIQLLKERDEDDGRVPAAGEENPIRVQTELKRIPNPVLLSVAARLAM